MVKTEAVIDTETQKNIDAWLQGDYDAATKEEIRRLQRDNPQELLNAFYKQMHFGTGGLRGIVGVGTNRMNLYTLRYATQGLASYILAQPSQNGPHRVFIGFDCRKDSQKFAEETAKVLAGNGIEVYLCKELRPLAIVSFGILQKQCIAGVMITASHNPPHYNGYKVFWSYGGQILSPHIEGISLAVSKITKNSEIKTASFPNPLIHLVGEEIDNAYIESLREWQLRPGSNQTHGKELKIVYTSLHGTGVTLIPRALRDWGFTSVALVEEQKAPDGSFPTVRSPNPEEAEAMALGVETLKQINGDILLGTDPDADRLGVVVMHHNKPVFFDGNQLACVLLEHICRSMTESLSIPPKAVCIKTIVTTELFRKIAEHYHMNCLDVLTGFKYIGEKIHQWDEEKKGNVPSHSFIFGAEESFGYLLGTHVRDKDAIIASLCVAEAALHMKLQGKTLVDLLNLIYKYYGVYREKLLSLAFDGKEGAEKMHKMMARLRQNPPLVIDDQPVTHVEDFLNHTSLDLRTGHKTPLPFPKGDVLRFWLQDESKIVIRPSGTEPKIKLYGSVRERHHLADQYAIDKAAAAADIRLATLLASVKKLLID